MLQKENMGSTVAVDPFDVVFDTESKTSGKEEQAKKAANKKRKATTQKDTNMSKKNSKQSAVDTT